MLDKCSEACGWIAGVVAALSFGTFGVPIKDVKSRIKVDPLVMQSYKSLLCFLTCWLVIPLGEPFKFTPWGIGEYPHIKRYQKVRLRNFDRSYFLIVIFSL